MIKPQCKRCGVRRKVLTDEGICWNCFVIKHKDVPKTGAYKEGK